MHSSSSRLPVALLAALVGLVLPFAAPLAARADGGAGTGVARVSFIDGSVAVQRGDSSTAVDAVINAPVLGGDYVTTGDAGRAEIQLDGRTAVRLGQNVQLRFTHLDTGNRQMQLAQGTVDLRVLRGPGANTDIDTPSISLRPRAAGSYRVTVDSQGATQVTVRAGAADIITPQGTRALLPGTTLAASGSADDPVLGSVAVLAADDFDRFNGDRDARAERAIANAYVDPDIEGAGELGSYGRWVADGSYGNVWVPNGVAADWAPYRYGRWVWEDYYGWTWVADEPWGWAPYHYGNWYHSPAYGWAWYPARPHVVAIWRPALVAFISFGSGGFGFGNIGWVPLAPFEPYRPWWGSHYSNPNVTTITNVTNVTNNYYGNAAGGAELARTYKNAQYNGVTAIGAKRFTEGRFEHPHAVAAAQLAQAAIVRGPVPVVPTQANLHFKPAGAADAQPPARRALVERSFAGGAAPVTRTPFEQQRSAIARVTHLRAEPVTNAAPATNGATNAASPWARFAAHGATPVNHPLARPEPNAADSWSRFGRNRGTPSTTATMPTTTSAKIVPATKTLPAPITAPRHTEEHLAPATTATHATATHATATATHASATAAHATAAATHATVHRVPTSSTTHHDQAARPAAAHREAAPAHAP